MSKMDQIWRGLHDDWLLWLAVGFIAGSVAYALFIDHHPESGPLADHPSVTLEEIDCEEDDVWMFVDHDTPGGLVDSHGVTRACRNFDDMLDMGIEVAIQEGVLMYVPSP